MTNEMKLLMALCDAMGFEVEEKPTSKSMGEFKDWAQGKGSPTRLEHDCDYKLTKKGPLLYADYMAGLMSYEEYLSQTGLDLIKTRGRK